MQIILSHGGRLGKFSLSQLLLALVTGFGLLAVAKVAMDNPNPNPFPTPTPNPKANPSPNPIPTPTPNSKVATDTMLMYAMPKREAYRLL